MVECKKKNKKICKQMLIEGKTPQYLMAFPELAFVLPFISVVILLLK